MNIGRAAEVASGMGGPMLRWFLVSSCAAALLACGGDSDPGGGPDGGVDGDGGGGDAGPPPVPGLDPSFGGDGVVTIGFDGGFAGLFRVARQDDGAIVGVGGTKESLLVMRVLADGSFDPGFGEDGVVELPWGVATNGVMVGYGCAIQPDGKILVAARVLGSYKGLAGLGVVVRLLPDGELDTSFAGQGYVAGPPGSSATSLALLEDGRILVGGYGRLERYLADGSRDPSFGTEGVSTTSMLVSDLAVQQDGSIVAVGGRVIARFTAAGAVDTGFGDGGTIQVPGQSSDALYAVALDPDDNILVGGAVTLGAQQQMWIGRYLPDGAVDEGFAGGAIGDDGTGGNALGLALAPDGKLLASGFTVVAGEAGRSARFGPDGGLDTTFGRGGVGAQFQNVLFSNVAVEPGGAFTAAGAGFGTGGATFVPVFTRTSAAGIADASFGAGGEVKRAVGGSFDRANAVAVQPDGKLLVGGWAYDAGGLGLVRLRPDGALDEGFGTGGRVTRSTNLSYVNSLAVDATGGVLVSGLSAYSNPRGFVVERFLESGVLDEGFGGDGVGGGQLIEGQDAVSLAMTRAEDGSIVVVGQTAVGDGTTEIGVMVLEPGGGRDTTFGVNGAATSAFGAGYSMGTHAVMEPDGAVVVLGLTQNQVALLRFTAAGALDEEFGPVMLPESAGLLPLGLARQPDGALVVVAGNVSGALRVVRYTAAGALDASFGEGGVVAEVLGGNDYYGLYAFAGLAILPDGRIAVGIASASDDGLVERGVLVRLLPDGTPDEELAPGGQQEIALGRGSTALHAMALDASGRLLVVGRSWTEAGGSDFLAMRFHP